MRTYRTVSARSAAGVAGFILYVTVGSAVLTHALSGTGASRAVESAGMMGSGNQMHADLAETTPNRGVQGEPVLAAPVVIGITVENDLCEGHCEDSFSVRCTTHADGIGTDWLIVRRADFGRLYHELGCESNVG